MLGGTLGGSQLGGTYNNAVTLPNGGNSFSGTFAGSGAALTGIQFSQLGGAVGGNQLSGNYNQPLTLSNTSNQYYGDGSNLTGVVAGPGSPYYIQNGNALQSSASFNISGNGALGGSLSANTINSGSFYQIGGIPVVSAPGTGNLLLGQLTGSHNTTGINNTFSGSQAGYSNIDGNANTFSGFQAGYSNTGGSANTFVGYNAGVGNITGTENTFSGFEAGGGNHDGLENAFYGNMAGINNNGNSNVFIGYQVGFYNNQGDDNTFSGYQAGFNNAAGVRNTFYGFQAGYGNAGNYNTFLGEQAGYSNGSGSRNVFVGEEAGYKNTNGSHNVYIATPGPNIEESDTIRLGDGSFGAAYIGGIYGVGVLGVNVQINSDGRLGVQSSSRRFKEQIVDMGDGSSKLFQLRPVTFHYKPQYDDGSHLQQYGLIAEEVAEVYPEMVAYDRDGQASTVKYQLLAPMLLNELQKQHAVVTAQQDLIKAQQQQIQTQDQQIRDLQQRLTRLESVIEKN